MRAKPFVDVGHLDRRLLLLPAPGTAGFPRDSCSVHAGHPARRPNLHHRSRRCDRLNLMPKIHCRVCVHYRTRAQAVVLVPRRRLKSVRLFLFLLVGHRWVDPRAIDFVASCRHVAAVEYVSASHS